MARKARKSNKKKKVTKVGTLLNYLKGLPKKGLDLLSNLWDKVRDRASCLDCWAGVGSLLLGVALLVGCLDISTISGILLIGLAVYLFRNDYH